MGLVQDAAALAFSGYSKTSGALTLINKLGGETENLVCASLLYPLLIDGNGTDSIELQGTKSLVLLRGSPRRGGISRRRTEMG